MEINFENILLEKEQIRAAGTALGAYLDDLKEVVRQKKEDRPEYSLAMTHDHEGLDEILELKREKTSHSLKYIIVVGIGGSNLGAKAIYDCLKGYFVLIKPDEWPKILFADTNDPEWLAGLASFLEKNINRPEEVLLVVSSKAGHTLETNFNSEFFFSVLKRQLGKDKAVERTVIITSETSRVWPRAKDLGISRLAIPISVGGRYSVFSAAGLFPLAAAGLDVRAVLEGANSILDHGLDSAVLSNSAAMSAITLFLHYQAKKNIHDLFVFHPELESLGKWYRQLMAESLGKREDVNGETVRAGILPTVSVGSSDLHSMVQLYLGGPNNRVTTFVYSDKRRHYGRALEPSLLESEMVEPIANKTASAVMEAILTGVERTYSKNKLPFITVAIPGLSEYSLAQFMQWKMIEIMLLAKLMNVNAFDQPNVEDYKVETRKVLMGE